MLQEKKISKKNKGGANTVPCYFTFQCFLGEETGEDGELPLASSTSSTL